MRKHQELTSPASCMSRAGDDEEGEVWKPIPRFGGRYEISSFGRVRRSATAAPRFPGRVRKLRANRDGYLTIGVRYQGQNRPFLVNRLVMEVFVGRIPDGLEVNHKDGDKQNNRPSNLEAITHSENVRHANAAGLIPKGESHYKATFTADQIGEIRAIHAAGGRYEGGPTFASTARRFGVTPGAIVRIVRRRVWRHVP